MISISKAQSTSDSESENKVKRNMRLDYSYSQPSKSEDLFGNDVDSDDSETDALIRRDQAEISLKRRSPVQYPPQPEVEFDFPQRCYCGAQPVLATSDSRWNDIGRRYYTCVNVNDGECHIWKWWDEAVMEEMRARDRHVLLLSEKVDSLALSSAYETEQKLAVLEKMVCDLAKEKSKFSYGFEFFLGVMVLVLVLIGVVLLLWV